MYVRACPAVCMILVCWSLTGCTYVQAEHVLNTHNSASSLSIQLNYIPRGKKVRHFKTLQNMETKNPHMNMQNETGITVLHTTNTHIHTWPCMYVRRTLHYIRYVSGCGATIAPVVQVIHYKTISLLTFPIEKCCTFILYFVTKRTLTFLIEIMFVFCIRLDGKQRRKYTYSQLTVYLTLKISGSKH